MSLVNFVDLEEFVDHFLCLVIYLQVINIDDNFLLCDSGRFVLVQVLTPLNQVIQTLAAQ